MSSRNRGTSTDSSAGHDAAQQALGRFRVIFRSVRRHFQDVEQRCGISGSQLWLLSVVLENPGIRVTELARRLSVHQSTVSNLIEVLCRRGLIVRERCNQDRRVVQLKASPQAGELISKAPRPVQGLLPDALSHLSASEAAILIKSLDAVLAVMRRRQASARFKPLADA